jgi:hypothetical protein
MNRCVPDLQILQLYSQGVMPPKVLSNGAKLSAAKTRVKCVWRRSRLSSWYSLMVELEPLPSLFVALGIPQARETMPLHARM